MDVTHVSEYVMNTLCRICAEKSSKLIPIFKDNLLSQKIDKCLPIKVARSDHLPLNVCESCFVRIDESYLFYEMVCQSDERLKKLWKILIKETLIRCPDIVPPENNKFKNELFNTQSDISCDNQQSKKLEAKQDNNLIKDNLSNFITNASEVTYSGLEFTDSNEEKIDEVMVLEKAVDLDSAKHIIEKTSVKG